MNVKLNDKSLSVKMGGSPPMTTDERIAYIRQVTEPYAGEVEDDASHVREYCRFLLAELDAARAKDAEAHAAEVAALHDIIAAYEAQAVVQDLRDQLAAKDAEIARLKEEIKCRTCLP